VPSKAAQNHGNLNIYEKSGLGPTQAVAKLTIKTSRIAAREPVTLSVEGVARIEGRECLREAVPAEDRMQAFLWRHLVPAVEFKVLVFDPSDQPPARRIPRPAPRAQPQTNSTSASTEAASAKSKFTKRQVAGRLRELKLLFEEGLLTDDFYAQKVAECEAAR
jgi:hypothetical protein